MRVRWTLGAFVAAAVTLCVGQARAQEACAVPEEVPEGVYIFYVDQLDELPLLGPDGCSKLTKGAVATCHKAVASMIKCWQSMYRSTYKAQRIACGATVDPAQCSADHKGLLGLMLEQIDAGSGGIHAECDGVFAEAIYDACLAV